MNYKVTLKIFSGNYTVVLVFAVSKVVVHFDMKLSSSFGLHLLWFFVVNLWLQLVSISLYIFGSPRFHRDSRNQFYSVHPGKSLLSCSGRHTGPFQFWWQPDPWRRRCHPFERCWRQTAAPSVECWQRGRRSHSGCFQVHRNLRIVHTGSQFLGNDRDMIVVWTSGCICNPTACS